MSPDLGQLGQEILRDFTGLSSSKNPHCDSTCPTGFQPTSFPDLDEFALVPVPSSQNLAASRGSECTGLWPYTSGDNQGMRDGTRKAL